jgi:pimeloyl-ACP methyl ester carboxylesterase
LLSPLFVLSAPFRLWPEIAAAFPGWDERLAFTARHIGRVVLAPLSPKRMGGRVRLLAGEDFLRDCSLIRAPTLVVTGERDLDKVVPVEGTREYLGAIAGATSATIERTGHIGLISRPERFSNIVATFIAAHDPAGQTERQRAS